MFVRKLYIELKRKLEFLVLRRLINQATLTIYYARCQSNCVLVTNFSPTPLSRLLLLFSEAVAYNNTSPCTWGGLNVSHAL
jgi:hypothetical protein